jgi:hypothetical protein
VKGALVVCSRAVDPLALFASIAEHSERLEAASCDGSVQLTDDRGRKLTVFGDPVPMVEWERERQAIADRSCCVNGEDLRAYEVECRWEDLFCCVVHLAAAKLDYLVVVDGNSEVHPGTAVRPESIQL